MKTEHTPLPWAATGAEIDCDSENAFAGMGPNRAVVKANAEYIVRACNALPDLVAALRECQEKLLEVNCGSDFETECWDAANRAASALAKAQPEEGK